ncbi:uncharacterized protein Z520_10288 [Fonsecaea multimorphosa CBS 102226]|uniref:Uncharacterized protein n=1 Tax=Fonsecaea multimorphosa CBS 102226 TaxID=1442371 RepID=A0A0D2I9W3_9EURO|nr:uncharacterized protein Z520_10288 [Fonsecaea multimorphosa CBS 102226]KIX93951.1 hypothetical protein Z520_10288 [Fonsecaea multimorphosa CBS 102226]OAL19299.1 hypothetical protein AYO22_09843 [Fonsecaea multimorphosa]
MTSNQPQHSQNPSAQEKDAGPTSSPPLALPAPQDAPTSATEPPQSTFKLDALGPLVINSDGTLSRIHNWAEMTELERERTLRILGKRNQLRRDNKLDSEAEHGNTEPGK